MERAVGTQYFPCISRPYETFRNKRQFAIQSEKNKDTLIEIIKEGSIIRTVFWDYIIRVTR